MMISQGSSIRGSRRSDQEVRNIDNRHVPFSQRIPEALLQEEPGLEAETLASQVPAQQLVYISFPLRVEGDPVNLTLSLGRDVILAVTSPMLGGSLVDPLKLSGPELLLNLSQCRGTE